MPDKQDLKISKECKKRGEKKDRCIGQNIDPPGRIKLKNPLIIGEIIMEI